MHRPAKALTALAASALALTGCSTLDSEIDLPSGREIIDSALDQPSAADAAAGAGTINAAAAHAELAGITVAPESTADYDRTRDYGGDWASIGGGCDTRDAVMVRDMADYTLRDDGCSVATGTLSDPYTGQDIAFEFGSRPGQSDAVQIDHSVPASEAHDSGAAEWTQAEREAFYVDTFNLIAVDGPTNNSKGDQDAADWLPPNGAYQCQYAASQIQVKAKYALTMDPAEHDALADILDQC